MFKLFMSDIYPNNAARIRSKGTGLFIKSFTFTKQKQMKEFVCLPGGTCMINLDYIPD